MIYVDSSVTLTKQAKYKWLLQGQEPVSESSESTIIHIFSNVYDPSKAQADGL